MRLVSLEESKAHPCTPWDFEKDGHLDRQVMEDMVRVLISTPMWPGLVSVAMAAPQVGIFKRFFCVAIPGRPVRWVVNPSMHELTDKTSDSVEGCLTVPGQKFIVPRLKSVRLIGQDEKGAPIQWAACKDLLGRIVQHEIGHLDGLCIKDFGRPCTEHRANGVSGNL